MEVFEAKEDLDPFRGWGGVIVGLPTKTELWDLILDLTYHKGDAIHGSASGFTRADVLDCDFDEALHYQERLIEFRKRDARSVRATTT